MRAEPRLPEIRTAGGPSSPALADRVGVVVISYYSDELVTALLGRLPEEVPVVVIDNARETGLGPLLAAAHPGAIYRHFPENLGFGGAANVGVSLLDREFVLILNPDTQFDPELLARGLKEMEADPRIGAGGELRFLKMSRLRLGRYVTGAFLLMRRAAFDAVGRFDEDFFLFFEDTDLSVRIEGAGYRLVGLADLPRHRDGHSVDPGKDSRAERLWLIGASARLFQSKHRFSRAGVWVRWLVLKRAFEARRVESARIFMKGYRDAKGRLPGCLRDNLFTTGIRRA